MIAFSMALSGVGFAVGKTAALMNAWSAGKSLQPPEDLGNYDLSTAKSRDSCYFWLVTAKICFSTNTSSQI